MNNVRYIIYIYFLVFIRHSSSIAVDDKYNDNPNNMYLNYDGPEIKRGKNGKKTENK
jgi:hypothetical protein